MTAQDSCYRSHPDSPSRVTFCGCYVDAISRDPMRLMTPTEKRRCEITASHWANTKTHLTPRQFNGIKVAN